MEWFWVSFKKKETDTPLTNVCAVLFTMMYLTAFISGQRQKQSIINGAYVNSTEEALRVRPPLTMITPKCPSFHFDREDQS